MGVATSAWRGGPTSSSPALRLRAHANAKVSPTLRSRTSPRCWTPCSNGCVGRRDRRDSAGRCGVRTRPSSHSCRRFGRLALLIPSGPRRSHDGRRGEPRRGRRRAGDCLPPRGAQRAQHRDQSGAARRGHGAGRGAGRAGGGADRRRRQGVRLRRRYRRDARHGARAGAPVQSARAADVRRHRGSAAAVGGGRQRVRARGRLRACLGLRHAAGRGDGQVRPAGDRARHHARGSAARSAWRAPSAWAGPSTSAAAGA